MSCGGERVRIRSKPRASSGGRARLKRADGIWTENEVEIGDGLDIERLI
jgi:hypothetical protein